MAKRIAEKRPDGFIDPRERFDKIAYYDPYDLEPTMDNPRDHTDSIEALKASIREYGWTTPIILHRPKRNKNGTVAKGSPLKIVAGHNRHQAAMDFMDNGLLAEVPCVFIDDLTEEQARAYLLDDNRVSDLSEWAPMELQEFVKGLDEMKIVPVAWTPDELDDIRRDFVPVESKQPGEFPQVGMNIDVQHKCPKCGYEWSGDGQKKND